MLRNVPFLEPELGGDFNISGWNSPGLYLAPLHERQPVATRITPVLVASSISTPGAPVVTLAAVNPLQQNALMPLLLLGAAALLLLKA